jgi:hypothetical protein
MRERPQGGQQEHCSSCTICYASVVNDIVVNNRRKVRIVRERGLMAVVEALHSLLYRVVLLPLALFVR